MRGVGRGRLAVLLLLVAAAVPLVYRAFVPLRRQIVMARYFERERWHELRFLHATRCQPQPAGVLIGDSMTAGFAPHWPGPATVVNMGIPGDFSAGVFSRLATVVACRPRKVFVMVGVNDLVERVPLAEVEANLLRIVRTLHAHIPGVQVHLQSVLPTFNRFSLVRSSADINLQVRALNTSLAARARAENYVFIDLYPTFVDGEDQLRPELNYDGIHLNRDGYALWYERLAPYLAGLSDTGSGPSVAAAAPRPGGS